jgi:dihydrofolate synthase/folylpolyglutamate synthase
MPHKSYTEVIDWLFTQFPSYQNIGAAAYKPDILNTEKLCRLFSNPQNQLKCIHIAGTNGKGSTSSLLASILKESGETVGLFTSPHIIDFRERIRINGEKISEQSVVEFCTTIQDSQLDFDPSFFEISFVMALNYFKRMNCSICVIETGLGGRLDATNIVQPIASVITNISLEHTQYLGNTISEIAFEKAGIIKENSATIIGETTPETKKVFESVAHSKRNVSLYWSENEEKHETYSLPFIADYQKINFRTVLCTIQVIREKGITISRGDIEKGIKNLTKNTGFFGRLQQVGVNPLTLLDVSHNYDGIKKTLESVKKINRGKLHLIYGTSADKNYKEIIGLFPANSKVNLCSFSNSRSLNTEQLIALSTHFEVEPKIFSSVKTALSEVQSIANKEDTILVFGSFFLVSDFF